MTIQGDVDTDVANTAEIIADMQARKDDKIQREARLAIAETFDAWLDWLEETAPEQVEDVFFELGCFATAMGNVIELVLQLLTQLQVVFPVGLEVRAVRIDLAIDLGHRIPRLHAARLHGPRWWARAGVVRAAC